MNTNTTPVVVDPKPWHKSRTIRFNIACAILFGLELQFSAFQPYMPGDVYAWLSALLIIGNKVLRVLTDSPVFFGVGNDQSA